MNIIKVIERPLTEEKKDRAGQIKNILLLTFLSVILSVNADYALQIGAFSEPYNAASYAEEMEKRTKLPATVIQEDGLSKVLIGKTRTYLEADYLRNGWSDKYGEERPFVRPLADEESEKMVYAFSQSQPHWDIFLVDERDLNMGESGHSQLLYRETDERVNTAYLEGDLERMKNLLIELEEEGDSDELRDARLKTAILFMYENQYDQARELLEISRRDNDFSALNLAIEYQLGLLELRVDNDHAARRWFERVSFGPANEYVVGKAHLRLAYLSLRQGDEELAKEYFMNVARGEVTIQPEERMESMSVIGALYHRNGDFRRSYKAFTELEQYAKQLEANKEGGEVPEHAYWERAKAEKAGLLMQSALKERGTLEESRREAVELIESRINPAARNWRARAILMKAECDIHEQSYESALNILYKYEEDFKDLAVEKDAALYWKGRCHSSLGRHQRAVEYFEEIVLAEREYEEVERFKHFDTRKRACQRAIQSLEVLGDNESKVLFQNILQQEYPESIH